MDMLHWQEAEKIQVDAFCLGHVPKCTSFFIFLFQIVADIQISIRGVQPLQLYKTQELGTSGPGQGLTCFLQPFHIFASLFIRLSDNP